jgi:hypothetical protein
VSSRIRLMLFVSLLAAALTVAGCGGGSSASSGTSSKSDPCAATAAPAGPPSLTACLSGPLTGTATDVGAGSTCSAEVKAGDNFDVTYMTVVNGEPTQVELTSYKGPGTFDLTFSTDANISISQTSKQLNWSNVASGGSGKLTVAPDRSGSFDAVVAARDYSSGVDLPNAPKLTIKGTFRCPPPSSS